MYAKVFAQIFDSSIAEDYQTRHVFMDLLVLADKTGMVDMTHESIARRTNVPIEIVRDAICKLCKHDVNSRSPECGGARLVKLDEHRDWGWQIVNFARYHNLRDENGRRAYMRSYMQRRRAAEKGMLTDVNRVNTGKPPLAHVDVDVNRESAGKPTDVPVQPLTRVEKAINDIGITVPDCERKTFDSWVAAVGEDFVVDLCGELRGKVLSFFPFKEAVEEAKKHSAKAGRPAREWTTEERIAACRDQYGDDVSKWPRDMQQLMERISSEA